MRLGSGGQELDSVMGYSFPQVPAHDLPAEFGAPLRELAKSPALLYLTSPRGPGLSASITKKTRTDQRNMGEELGAERGT